MNISDSELNKIISKLPDNIQKSIREFDWPEVLKSIRSRFKLSLHQEHLLRNNIELAVAGILPAKNFESEIRKDLNINPDTSKKIVLTVNNEVFNVLQKTAFQKKEAQQESTSEEPISFDPYLEPIDHDDLRGDLSGSGIHLVDDDEEKEPIDTHLHKEVSAILEGIDTNDDSTPQPQTKKSDLRADIDEEVSPTPEKQVGSAPSQYHEEITDEDLRGIDSHRTDTKILKHTDPGKAFTSENTHSSLGRDLGQGNYFKDHSHDKKIHNEGFTPTTESHVFDKNDGAEPSLQDITKD